LLPLKKQEEARLKDKILKGNKKMNQIIRITVFCLIFIKEISVSYSQNFKDDLAKINNAYLTVKEFSMDIDYKVYSDNSFAVPLETQHSFLYKKDDCQYTTWEDNLILVTSDYSILIDTTEREILVSKSEKFDAGRLTMLNFDSLSKNKNITVNFEKVNAEVAHYKIVFSNRVVSEYDEMDIYFNVKTFFLDKLGLLYRRSIPLKESDPKSKFVKPRLEIQFALMNLHPKFRPNLFSEKRFFKKENGKLEVSNEYKEYQLINHLK
jgi:hypothetical protein